MAEASVSTTGQTGLAASPVRRKRWLTRFKRTWTWYLFLAPNLIMFLVFNLFVWGFLIYLSFQSWDLIGSRRFIGLDNYQRMLSDPIFATALKNTTQYTLMFVLPVTVISLAIAMLANQPIRGMYFFRAAYYLPVVTSIAVLAMIWRFMLIPRADGPLNYMIGQVGIPPQEWLINLRLAMPSVVGMQIWATMGYYMILWLAGLQNIPDELYDAAKIDGAGNWALFRYITLPMLRATTIFIIMIATIGAFQMFGAVYILTGGGPVHATTTVVYYVWQSAFSRYRMGYAASMSLVLFALIFIVALVQRKYLGWSEDLY
ncbi:sugar ABC transporter permease [Chloroflexi bacterium TSY]|nr:sugar ABC transporter permease [Chloroflexi bacterium TSY]